MRVFHWFRELSAKWGWIALLVYTASQIGIGFLLGPKVGPNLLRFQLTFTKSGFDDVIATWGPPELACFRRHFYLDFAHPVWYGFLLAFLLAKAIPRDKAVPQMKGRLVLIPILAAICDGLENIVHCVPAFQGTLVQLDQPSIALAATFASAKWLLVVVSLGLIVLFKLRRTT